MSDSQKRKKERSQSGRKKGVSPLNPQEVTSAKREGLSTREGGATAMAAHLFAPQKQQ